LTGQLELGTVRVVAVADWTAPVICQGTFTDRALAVLATTTRLTVPKKLPVPLVMTRL
jgi:hypothetical protein